jgi:hypothetical protein
MKRCTWYVDVYREGRHIGSAECGRLTKFDSSREHEHHPARIDKNLSGQTLRMLLRDEEGSDRPGYTLEIHAMYSDGLIDLEPRANGLWLILTEHGREYLARTVGKRSA